MTSTDSIAGERARRRAAMACTELGPAMHRPYCWSVGTRSRPRHPFLDFPGPLAFAHRGGASEAPENTLPAFQRAVDLGYRYLETDVHVTSDGVLVAFHDDDLSRTCGRPGLIHELPWSEVSTARVDGREPIPRLDDLLARLPGAPHQHRLQDPTPRSSRSATSSRRPGALDRVCVGAFSDAPAAAAAPAVRVGAVLERRTGRARACCGSSASPSPAVRSPPRCRRSSRACR